MREGKRKKLNCKKMDCAKQKIKKKGHIIR